MWVGTVAFWIETETVTLDDDFLETATDDCQVIKARREQKQENR